MDRGGRAGRWFLFNAKGAADRIVPALGKGRDQRGRLLGADSRDEHVFAVLDECSDDLGGAGRRAFLVRRRPRESRNGGGDRGRRWPKRVRRIAVRSSLPIPDRRHQQIHPPTECGFATAGRATSIPAGPSIQSTDREAEETAAEEESRAELGSGTAATVACAAANLAAEVIAPHRLVGGVNDAVMALPSADKV